MFVTHDIDEALRLGDKVAVFGRGGVLQQYDEPARLLSQPANDFVARFIGLGRGYRWLQLIDAAGSADARRRTDPSGRASPTWAARRLGGGGRRRRARRMGWIDAEGLRRHRGGGSLSDSMSAVGSLFRPDGNSAARRSTRRCRRRRGWASPSTARARSIGGVLAADVLAAVEAQTKG